MEVGGAILNGVIGSDMPFKSLVQVASLCNVDGNPLAIFGLPGVNIVSRQGLKGSFQGVNLVCVILSRLPGPVDESRSGFLGLPVAAK
jgi:hypothetical protein